MPCNNKGEHIRKECSRREDHGYEDCQRYEDHGYSACNDWDKQCCDWWPCSWGCKVLTWLCRGWVWISNMVCVAWVWISHVVCVAYAWVVDGICFAWHYVVGAFSGILDGFVCGTVESLRKLFGGGTPACDPDLLFSQITSQKAEIVSWFDETVGVITTPFKCLGIKGWDPTGCTAKGSGTITREVAWSTDGLYTIDVELQQLTIGGQARSYPLPNGNHGFIRLEVRPFRQAWNYCNAHRLEVGDTLEFAGPVMWDHDKEWLEIHPQTLRHGERVGQIEQGLERAVLPPIGRKMTPAGWATLGIAAVAAVALLMGLGSVRFASRSTRNLTQ